jgi:hypothetical protein
MVVVHEEAIVRAFVRAVLLAGATAARLSAGDLTQSAQAFAVEFADGRVSYTYLHPDKREGGFWTSTAPYVPDAGTSRNGALLKALDVRHVLDGVQVIARVRLLYGTVTAGSPSQEVVEVAAFTMNKGDTVRVDRLTSYGLEPIRMWMADVPPAVAAVPAAETTSDRLSVRIEATSGAVPGLRIFVTNQSQMVLRSFRIVTYRKGLFSASSGAGGTGQSPLLEPGATHTVFWRPLIGTSSAGTPEWVIPDRVVIESTVWSEK